MLQPLLSGLKVVFMGTWEFGERVMVKHSYLQVTLQKRLYIKYSTFPRDSRDSRAGKPGDQKITCICSKGTSKENDSL